jgi:hypothetical protein
MSDQLLGRGIDPVSILDHKKDWALTRKRSDNLHERVKRIAAELRGIGRPRLQARR